MEQKLDRSVWILTAWYEVSDFLLFLIDKNVHFCDHLDKLLHISF